MKSKYIFIVLMSALAVNAHAAEPASAFCRQVKKLPLGDVNKVKAMIGSIEPSRTSEGSTSGGRSIEDLERLVKPFALSEGLKDSLLKNLDDIDSDYSLYHNASRTVFDFMGVAGSEKCALDVWAERKGNQLTEMQPEPDLGDACDVVRLVGTYQKQPILIQYAFGPDEDQDASKLPPIAEVRIVKMNARDMGDVCVVKPPF
ncbi:hypothetical protein [Oryzifoliimicrobium ureilyticus]|uniref:hypothetical protein n=1 Tax=Oryzifoliimicrobium ureilyticus TaxID=3113724 RepID=UPI0030761334